MHQGDKSKGETDISKDSPLSVTLLEEYHNTPTGGHIRITKIYSHLRTNVTWEGMKKDINFISKCQVC